VKQSVAMIEEAENLKTLVVENKELRQELDQLKANHEKSIAQVLESSSMATKERDRKIAAQDKIISDLKNELGREKDISQALRAELQSLREEKTKIDDVILGTFHLSDLSFLRLLSMSDFS
jgi:predicted RNase H-like nuclease (RuvC/YqgF family)